jgi:hypothetical protein
MSIPFVDQTGSGSCKTELELKGDVTKLWAEYLKVPQISIRVTQRKTAVFRKYLRGGQQQRQVDLTRRAHLLELISLVGGVTEKAGGMIQVFRTRPPVCADDKAIAEWRAGTN